MPDRGRRLQAGVLDPSQARERIDVGRATVSAPLSDTVDYLWWVDWHAPTPHRQAVIPRPVVHLVAEPVDGVARLRVTGVQRRRFDRTLRGDGRAVAAAFRPAGFRAHLGPGATVSDLRDREPPAAQVWPDAVDTLAAAWLDPALTPEAAAGRLAGWLAERLPPPDPLADELARLVERADTDREIVRAEQLATLAGVSLRTLQRRFVEYVGIGPKWVVQRCRLLDVAAAAHGDGPVDWAALAADLGYADQSHLTRAFTALVGRPPAAYAAQA